VVQVRNPGNVFTEGKPKLFSVDTAPLVQLVVSVALSTRDFRGPKMAMQLRLT
jgi:hypothetical protein